MGKEKSKLVKGYKAFKSDFTCYNDHKYEVGKTYQHKGAVELCKSGFHFCVFPLAVLGYYDLIGTRFAEVESDDVRGDDGDKSVAGNITIKKEISFGDMIKAQISLVFSFCFTKEGKPTADSKETVSSERNAQLASSGYGAKLASSGDGAKLASSGYGAQLASSGYGAQLASSGDGAQLASSGDGAKLASSGDGAQLASSGDGAQLASSGYGAKLVAEGKNSVVAAIGVENRASGAVGSWLTLAEWQYTGSRYEVICVKTEQVDGKRIKANVAYKLVKGEFVAA